MAVQGSQPNAVKILIETGKDLRADLAGKNIMERGDLEYTPLALAIEMGESQIAGMIEKYLADWKEKRANQEELKQEMEEEMEEEEEDQGIPVDRDEL